jgi:tetraacyldisaccharide 4'-kinase
MPDEERTADATAEEPARLTGTARVHEWWRAVAFGGEQPAGAAAIATGALVMLSILYGMAASLSLWGRSLGRKRFDVPVISVGNIVAGGAGKTPMTIYLARRLKKEGRSVAIVSRGYGRRSRGTVIVSRGEKPLVKWRESGDEPYLMAVLVPGVSVVVSERRSAGVRLAVQKLGADAILLDDAFQHVQMARDLDIVVVDAAKPVGNGHLLPGGPLREHPSGVNRCDVIVATRCDRAGGSARVAGTLGPLAPHAPIVETRMKPVELWDVRTGETVAASRLRKGSVLALSSIADPTDFEATLKRLGMNVAGRIALPDHHEYTEDDAGVIVEAAREVAAEAIVTTEKDAVRLRPWKSRLPLVALGIELQVMRGEKPLRDAIREALEGGTRERDRVGGRISRPGMKRRTR